MQWIKQKCWANVLDSQRKQSYFKDLQSFVKEQYAEKCVYPKEENIYNALELTPFDKVKVVILGQDPYHGEFQANGLSFSVNKGVKIPPSLVNIYKELESDLGIRNVLNGDLSSWASQGVLLLNATLTVEQKKPGSHQNKGWEILTDYIIEQLSLQKQGIVFVLWGSYAQKKGRNIDTKKHLVIQSAHPSPLSVYRGFYGSKPFSKINTYLQENAQTPIDWNIPSR
ncbi:uracil-DNA glycosylase [Myroides sp. LJL115]